MEEQATETTSRSVDQVLEVARQQKRLLWLILVQLILIVPLAVERSFGVYILGVILSWIVAIICAYLIYRICKGLKISTLWLIITIVVLLIPYVNIVPLLLVNGKATKFLRENGVKVGLMGARRKSLEQICV